MNRSKGSRGSYGKASDFPTTLGERIRAVRMSWGWTLKHLGAAIHYSDRAVSNWEQETQRPGDPALGVVADLFGLTKEALKTGVGFRIPDPPRQMGGLLIAEKFAADMVMLPSQCEGIIALVDQETGTHQEVSLARMTQLAREARNEERPVWVVIGLPSPKSKKPRHDQKAT